jgi:hypothetical protein
MNKIKWLTGVVGLSLMGAMLGIAPAKAGNPVNNSDITGTNIWNNTAPVFKPGSKFDPQTLDTARTLSQNLQDAYDACQASQANVPNVPRRFALGQPNSDRDKVCTTAECQSLNQLVNDTRSFLNSLNQTQLEELKKLGIRVW